MLKLNFLLATILATVLTTYSVTAQNIDFGDNKSPTANDEECDDPRFFGPGMLDSTYDVDDIGHDANDCQPLFEANKIRLWVASQAKQKTQCSTIDFGDNSSDYPDDGLCGDIRFKGAAMDGILLESDTKRDANDCRAACESGKIFLRNYE